jgi:translation initiation factor IF-2
MAAKKSLKTNRPPIVTIMGHVDHGKTSLLDTIRHSNLTQKEHGGITQHIGAYQIDHQGQKITFIDTPGHAAFSKMRARGAEITDIVILVVAADDGVKPQTVESIKHIHLAKVPYIVAINKIDLPDASPEMVKAQLTEHQVFVEGYGGQVPVIGISALENQHIDQLLELILLVAELEELTADSTAEVEAVVIESSLDKSQGPLATVIVKAGTLTLGQTLFTHQISHTIRAMYNDLGERITQALPGQPVQLLGLKTPPPAGTIITTQSNIKLPQSEAEVNERDTEVIDKLKLIIKADTAGTLEAVIQSIAQDEIEFIDTGVGAIGEADVLLAHTTGAEIIGFNVNLSNSARSLAAIEKVKVDLFQIIYKLIEYIEQKVLERIEPTINEEITGEAQVAAIFNIKGEKIAGCQVISGKITPELSVHLYRNDKIITDSKIKSLKQGKADVKVVKSGNECGIVLKPEIDIKVGDVIKSYRIAS